MAYSMIPSLPHVVGNVLNRTLYVLIVYNDIDKEGNFTTKQQPTKKDSTVCGYILTVWPPL